MNDEKPAVAYDEYFHYLMHRSRLGGAYRKYWLYPRISRRLKGTVLDIGCGIGDMLAYRREVIGVDVNPKTVAYCRQRGLDARLIEPNVLPFEANTFDGVLMDNVLEHIEQPDKLLNEVRRVVKPNGRLLVGVPGIRGWNSDSDHKIFYDETSLRQCITKHNFVHIETFHTPLWKSAWLAERMRQYCVYGVFSKMG